MASYEFKTRILDSPRGRAIVVAHESVEALARHRR